MWRILIYISIIPLFLCTGACWYTVSEESSLISALLYHSHAQVHSHINDHSSFISALFFCSCAQVHAHISEDSSLISALLYHSHAQVHSHINHHFSFSNILCRGVWARVHSVHFYSWNIKWKISTGRWNMALLTKPSLLTITLCILMSERNHGWKISPGRWRQHY